jgi:hypothetical protein
MKGIGFMTLLPLPHGKKLPAAVQGNPLRDKENYRPHPAASRED